MSVVPLREPIKSCIGREKELTHLRRRFEEASRWGERLTLIQGPAGVGKTQLMTEFRSQMRLEGAVVLEGRCTAGARALAPIREILRRALAFLEEVGEASSIDLGPASFLLEDRVPLERVPNGMTHLEQRVQFFESYSSLLRALSRIKPPIVIVHDLQWADVATIELLTHLLDGAGPWREAPQDRRTMLGLVVASVREGEGSPAVRQLASHPKAETLDLHGFDEAAMVEFLRSPEVVRRLMRATGGNPEEVLAILDTPALGADRAHTRRVEKLEPESRMILAALGALGRPSEVSLVAHVAGLASMAKPLTDLLESGLVVKTVQDGEVLLRPARHQYADAAYEELSADERRRLHARAVEAFRGARGLAAQDVAFHALRAGERDVAVEAALEASTVLENAFAYEAAMGLLEDARPLATNAQAVELNRRLAELYMHSGVYDLALQRAEDVLHATPGSADARLRVAQLHALSGDYDAAADALSAASELVESSGDRALMAELAAAQAEVSFRRGDYEEALRSCSRAVEGTNPAATLALENTRGKILLARGEYVEAKRTFVANLEAARAAKLFREQAQALINLGIGHIREHEHAEATRRLEEALELARRADALRESAIALENLAVLAHFRRDFGAALDCYHSAVADLKRLGNRAMLARAANNLGELYLALGDPSRASNLGEFARRMAGDTPPPAIVAEGLLLTARVAMRTGDTAAARTALERASEIFGRLGERARAVEAELALTRLDIERGDVTGARARLKAIRSVEGLDHVRRGEGAALEAELERASFGNPLRAILVAIDCFEQAHDPERSWRAHLRAASFHHEAGDQAGHRRHLERAAAIESKVSSTVPEAFLEGLRADPDRIKLREAFAELTGVVEPTPAPPALTVTTLSPTASPPAVRETVVGNRPVAEGSLSSVFPCIVYRSVAMNQVLEIVQRVAPTDSIVLIRGESGTGKELVADAIHRLSHRRARPFIKVNCAALVETLLLSELFGHEKGAFTGAMARRKGRFEAADGGTLFLDEIGDISLTTQVSLLRVLQEQQFERVGGSTPIRTNVRIVCATNRDLEALVEQGAFREDLYYRLKGIQISLPPLRERPEDIEALARHFLKRTAEERAERELELSREALALLLRHPWPGNVRELENVLRSSSLFADGPALEAKHLAEFTAMSPSRRDTVTTVVAPARPCPSSAPPSPAPPVVAAPAEPIAQAGQPTATPLAGVCRSVLAGDTSLAEMKKRLERQCIEEALARTDGNITQAASMLGMKRPRLSQLVKEHGLLVRSVG